MKKFFVIFSVAVLLVLGWYALRGGVMREDIVSQEEEAATQTSPAPVTLEGDISNTAEGSTKEAETLLNP